MSDRPAILLFGGTGQIGWELERTLPILGTVHAPARRHVDLSDPSSIRRCVSSVNPAIIVNAAAYTAVDQAEDEPNLAFRINAEAPGILAKEAERLGAVLVHYSTDYVFDGCKGAPYTEDDQPAPINVYGRSKLEGEILVGEHCSQHLVLRTSWVYGSRGGNFLRTMLRLASERDTLRVVDDQVGSPTWSRMIAQGTAAMLARATDRRKFDLAGRTGIFHLAADSNTSWCGFARQIMEVCGYGEDVSVEAIRSDEYPTPAARPADSVLDCTRAEDEFGVRLPHWRRQLELVAAGLPERASRRHWPTAA